MKGFDTQVRKKPFIGKFDAVNAVFEHPGQHQERFRRGARSERCTKPQLWHLIWFYSEPCSTARSAI